MTTEHKAQQDDHLFDIARKHGFARIVPIWDHPQNAELKKRRKNPHILLAGDRIFIPDLEPKTVSAATNQRHRFVVAVDTLELHVKVHDQAFQPLHGAASLIDRAKETAMQQDGDIFKAPVLSEARAATLDFPIGEGGRQRPQIQIQIGRLDPLDTLSGQQQRLNNLGYFAGFVTPDPSEVKQPDAQFRWAVEEFQCDHMGSNQVDGILGPLTLQKLRDVYGC